MKTTLLFLLALILAFEFMAAQEIDRNNQNPPDKKKNAVFISMDFVISFSINYERLFPVTEKVSLGLRGGFGNDAGNKSLVIIGEGIFLYGKSKHFLEVGVGYQQPFYYFDEGPDSPLLGIMVGYRYQSLKGFMLKIYPEYLIEVSPKEDSWGNIPFLGLALGYSF